jgi:hypothetical protein
METVYIYTLSDPRDNLIKYVGKTVNPRVRKSSHCTRSVKTICGNWIKNLKRAGLLPVFEILDETNNEDWVLMEKYWISQIKAWGFNLKNMTSGGESTDPQLSSKIHKGKVVSKETREKISVSLQGRKLSIETKEKISSNASRTLRNNNTSRLLKQYNKETKYLVSEYTSIAEASETTNINKNAIANNVIGRSMSAGGYIWNWETINK